MSVVALGLVGAGMLALGIISFRVGSVDRALGIVAGTFGDVFGNARSAPAYEIALDPDRYAELERPPLAPPVRTTTADRPLTAATSKTQTVSLSVPPPPTGGLLPPTPSPPPPTNVPPPTPPAGGSLPPVECVFTGGGNPTGVLRINEIAWMGTDISSTDEWVELKNVSGNSVSLAGWRLMDANGAISVLFGERTLLPNNLYLLERTDDTTLPTVAADTVYTGALSNSGAWLKLFDASCTLVDEIDARAGWDSFGGDNGTKQTLERNAYDLGWHTSVSSGGTPKAGNSIPQSSASAPPPPPPAAPPSPPPSPPTPPAGGSPPAPPPQPTVLISVRFSEVMAGSSASRDDEFIELYNPTDQPIDMTGWELRKRTALGEDGSNLIDNGAFIGVIPAHGYFLVVSPAYTGTQVGDISYSAQTASIAYSDNALVLYDGDYRTGSVVDEIAWVEIQKDQSIVRMSWESADFVPNATPTPQGSGG